MPNDFHPGQRWISESEPELGLGSILRVTTRTVTTVFNASGERREYARANAPLRRVRFRSGDILRTHQGSPLTVQSVSERDGLLFYRCNGREFCETELSDAISFSKPEERLLTGHFDAPSLFELRLAALQHQHRIRKSSVRGFVGGRIELIPHQLYIASEIAGRLAPRVLLADEVGLGKTIEACLILHRLILTGRAQRVLILVPDSLVHQWFIELLRRFNLWFHIFDEERCEAIEAVNPKANPFLDDQFVLCSIGLFITWPKRLQQALDAEWDIVVIDEAHHLGWSPQKASPEYRVAEAFGRKTQGLLLLTATPEQLGMASHFARLRLLDPDRFHDLADFIEGEQHYRDVALRAETLLAKQELMAEDMTVLDDLLDQHGTGRVRFRNTRATITGFPRRVARLHPLDVRSGDADLLDAIAEEFASDTDLMVETRFGDHNAAPKEIDFSSDPRIRWLARLLRTLDPEKILLICSAQSKVAAIDSALRLRTKNLNIAVFHEGLSLIQRDRNAAWFAEEHGARILVCSEIGSEGRNFQFARHLVLFDLPLDPELLEQRIGRLDRIGQTREIQVHVPFVPGSAQEVLTRWYHEGLNAFEENLHAGRELLERFGERVYDLAMDFQEIEDTARAELRRVVQETRESRKEITSRLQQGRDRLLELNSFRPKIAARLVEEIRKEDRERSLDAFMLSVFDQYAIPVEEVAERTYRLGSAGVLADSFPGLPAEGLAMTSDRQRALVREDIQFLTWDHPLVTGALDLLLGSEKGNSSFAVWPDSSKREVYLEAIYLLECVAPSQLHIDRFLPPTPLRVMVDHHGVEVSCAAGCMRPGDPHALLERPEVREQLIPALIERTAAIVNGRVPAIVEHGRREMSAQLEHEIGRLRDLQKVNRSVRPEEIDLLVHQCRELDDHLKHARLRLDAIRLIQRGTV